MSNWRLVVAGGTVRGEGEDNDPHGRKTPSTHFAKHGALLVAAGILLSLLAPCIVLPSSFGFIAYEYTPRFLAAPLAEQYGILYAANALQVLDYIGLSVNAELPKFPAGWTGTGAMVLIALIDLAAAVALAWGAKRIIGNLSQLRELKEA
ncbi:MAG: hypothetical protein HKO62_13005 [Gammaproteobacteria bacterium]|nr:hypothetical protein [Gammaproteobacteria bacterium]NNM01665.1 hypothetical protein [Gammaproteobacteria bacterium]